MFKKKSIWRVRIAQIILIIISSYMIKHLGTALDSYDNYLVQKYSSVVTNCFGTILNKDCHHHSSGDDTYTFDVELDTGSIVTISVPSEKYRNHGIGDSMLIYECNGQYSYDSLVVIHLSDFTHTVLLIVFIIVDSMHLTIIMSSIIVLYKTFRAKWKDSYYKGEFNSLLRSGILFVGAIWFISFCVARIVLAIT